MRKLRAGVLHVTYHSVKGTIEEAKAIERAGFDTLWLAEAYPWWRKQGTLEPRSATALSALIAHETSQLTIGWGIVSPYARHPLQLLSEVRVLQETAGPNRFLLGLGASKILMHAIGEGTRKPARPLTAIRETIEIVRPLLEGDGCDYRGREYTAIAPPISGQTGAATVSPPIYIAGTGPKMQELAGEVADGLLTASLTTPAFVRYARGNILEGAKRSGRDAEAVEVGSTLVASIHESDRRQGREGAREIAAMYLANKVQNIRSSADVLLQSAQLTHDEIQPIADALDRDGLGAATKLVSDDLLDKVKPVAGTPDDCIAALEEYYEAGCTHPMLELWGDDRLRQIELFGTDVLPYFR